MSLIKERRTSAFVIANEESSLIVVPEDIFWNKLYEHLQKELEAAGNIQANILPQNIPLFPNHPQVDVCATLQSVSPIDDLTLVIKALSDAVAHFSKGMPPPDDITMLALRYRGNG